MRKWDKTGCSQARPRRSPFVLEKEPAPNSKPKTLLSEPGAGSEAKSPLFKHYYQYRFSVFLLAWWVWFG